MELSVIEAMYTYFQISNFWGVFNFQRSCGAVKSPAGIEKTLFQGSSEHGGKPVTEVASMAFSAGKFTHMEPPAFPKFPGFSKFTGKVEQSYVGW